jgi:alkyl hydroperoxide reductase subunit AhpF
MLGDLDIRRIRDRLADINEPLTLVLHPAEQPSELGDQLAAVAEEIAEACPDIINIKRGNGSGLPATPALSLAWRGNSNIHYLAVPQGPENLPFLEALLGMPRGAVGFRGEWARRLARLRRDAELMVFVAAICPHCARVVREAVHMALANPQIKTVVVDAHRLPELAERYAVKSVPVTILDRGLAKIGPTSADELTDLILGR